MEVEHWGHTERLGRSKRHADARRARVRALLIFLLGTGIVDPYVLASRRVIAEEFGKFSPPRVNRCRAVTRGLISVPAALRAKA